MSGAADARARLIGAAVDGLAVVKQPSIGARGQPIEAFVSAARLSDAIETILAEAGHRRRLAKAELDAAMAELGARPGDIGGAIGAVFWGAGGRWALFERPAFDALKAELKAAEG